MMRKDMKFLAKAGYARKALLLLDEDPLIPGSEPPAFASTPDSARYSSHLQVMNRNVLEVFGTYMPKRKAIIHRGVVMRMPYIVRYSAVHKTPADARAIFNMKRTNKEMNANKVAFSLPGAARLIAEFRKMPLETAKLRILHFDVANCFYNGEVSELVGRCCCVRSGNLVYITRACAMGWLKSCGIFQSLTMACVLYKEETEDEMGVPNWATEGDDAPGFIPLEGGGGIACVYDSVIVIAPEDRAKVWYCRMKRNFRNHRLLLKFITLEELNSSPLYCGIQLHSDRTGLSWAPEAEALQNWKTIAKQALRPSPRTLFRLLGYLRHVAAILGWPRYRLGRLTKAQSELGLVKDEEWDLPYVEERHIVEACALILDIDPEEKANAKSHIKKRKRADVFFFAVDATPTTWAVFPMSDGEVETDACVSGNFGETFTNDEHGAQVRTLCKWDIDDAEAFAMKEGITLGHSRGHTLMCGAGDSQSVGHCYNNGYSKGPVIDRMIVEAEYVKSTTLILADVKGIENISDVGTRPDKAYSVRNVEYRTAGTWTRLQNAYAHWEKTAETYLKRTQGDFEEIGEPPSESDED